MSDQVQIGDVAQSLYRGGQEDEIKALAGKLNLGYADLRKTHIPNEVLAYLSRDEAIQYKAVPIKSEPHKLFLGITDPEKNLTNLLNALRKDYGIVNIHLVLISEPSYLEWLPKYNTVGKMTPLVSDDEKVDLTKVEEIKTFTELAKQLPDAPIQELLKMILFTAFASGASDIHVEPKNDYARIRFRLDGALHEVARLDLDQYKYLMSQVELNSNLKLNSKEPQGGRFSIKMKDRELGVRIETMPSMHGDDLVIRLFNTQAVMLKISELGLSDYALPKLENALLRPHGIILVVGPTGAGKTSTIYAILNQLNTDEVKIITLEDPVEYELPGATQSQINEGELFGDRLKAVLREDPDIIMVGEIREAETAQTAIQAALTGHLLISSIHGNDAITAIARLYDMIGDPTLITASLNLVIAQRLVRKICPACREEYILNDFEQKELEKILSKMPDSIKPNEPYTFYHGKGCPKCQNIGYKGRIGIFEILEPSPEVIKLINMQESIFALQDQALKDGMITMEQDGLLKALSGITTFPEILKSIKE